MEAVKELSVRIAGEIALSKQPNVTIKKWRELFGVTQSNLAKSLGVSASVVSDYEAGRRKSPGVGVVKKIVDALIESDKREGSRILRAYERFAGDIGTRAILDMREFAAPMRVESICDIVNGEIIANEGMQDKYIYGYTAIDSPRAILEFSAHDFLRLYGLTSERALIFTKVSSGRSPFIAIRVTSIKPGLVVLHGPKSVDELGIRIAERERLPVILSRIKNAELLIKELRRKTS